tara:strand:- start:1783 stop:3465 length:1683 start_codon:yes stop_codon:yes gene_type:complete
MNFFKDLFFDIKLYFRKGFLIFFSLILISALLDFFAVISFIPIINILFPDIVSGGEQILQFYVKTFDFFNLEYNTVSLIILIITIFFLVKFIEFTANYYSFKIANQVKFQIQKDFLFKLNKCFLSYFVNIRTGEITNLYNREIGIRADIYRMFFTIIGRLIIFFILLIFLLINEAYLTTIILSLIILIIFFMRKFYKIIENNASKIINEQKKISSSITFFVNNIFSIRNSIYEDTQIDEIKNQTNNFINSSTLNHKYGLMLSSFIEPIFIITIIFTIYIIFKINSDVPTNYIINIAALLRFARHFLSIQSYYIKIINWKRYYESTKFHEKLLEDFSDDLTRNKEKISKISQIQVENLSVAYGDSRIFEDININLKTPFAVKLDGKNGSGKTTLVRTLMGLIKINSGIIKYNKLNLNLLDKKFLTNKICVLDKNPLIIKGSLLDNIQINPNKNIEKKDIIKFIYDFELSNIFNENNLEDQIIQEDGKNLSQGQMQKISIIRALVNEFEVLVLDEGLSNIDESNEKKIMNYLIELFNQKKMSLILISHKSNYDYYFKQKISL